MQIHMVNYLLRKAKKESRVSTLTLAQSGDKWFDIEYNTDLIIDLMIQICKWIVSNYSLILFYDGGARQLAI